MPTGTKTHKLSDVLLTYTLEDLVLAVHRSHSSKSSFAPDETVTLMYDYGGVKMSGEEYLNLLAELRVKGKL